MESTLTVFTVTQLVDRMCATHQAIVPELSRRVIAERKAMVRFVLVRARQQLGHRLRSDTNVCFVGSNKSVVLCVFSPSCTPVVVSRENLFLLVGRWLGFGLQPYRSVQNGARTRRRRQILRTRPDLLRAKLR